MHAAVFDSEHPHVGMVNQLVAPWHFGGLVESGVALLLDDVGTIGNGLLKQLDHVGFGFVKVA